MSEKKTITIGTGWFPPALTLLFVYLKANDQIDWSWWLVFLPVLFPIGIVTIFAVVTLIMWLAAAALDWYDDYRNSKRRRSNRRAKVDRHVW